MVKEKGRHSLNLCAGAWTALRVATLVLLGSLTVVAQNARIQVVHNVADPGLPLIDVFVNGLRVYNDLEFRGATPYLEVPAGSATDIGIASHLSTNAADTLKNTTLALQPNANYVLFVSGLRGDGFLPNPDGLSTDLRLVVKEGARRSASKPNTVDLIFMHGITDAPGIDLRELGFGSLPIFADVAYGGVSDYTTINPVDFNVVLTQTTLQAVILQAFNLSLSTRAGRSVSIVASGFVDPRRNCTQISGCPSVALLAVFDSGDVLELPIVEESQFISRMQFIHAAGDRELREIDVYLNGQLLFDDLPFNNALPYRTIFTGESLDLGIALPSSGSARDTLQNFRLSFPRSDNFTVALVGVLSPFLFAPNPEGRDIGLRVAVAGGGRVVNSGQLVSDYRVLNAVTDASPLDLRIRQGEALVGSLGFGEISDIQTIAARFYKLDVSPTAAPVHVLASYPVNFLNFGKPVTFIVTGFLDKFANRLGDRVQLKAVYSDGFVAEWPLETISDETARVQFIHAAPDPLLGAVDFYLQNNRLYDDFTFQSGKAFMTVLADSLVEVGVAAATSTGPENIAARFPVSFEGGKRYTAVLAGVSDPDFFAPNPDGAPIDFTLLVQDGAREAIPADPRNTEFRLVYAVPDGPKADIYVDNIAVVADTASFGTISDYVGVDSEGSSFPNEEGYYLNFQRRGDVVYGRSIIKYASVGRRAVTVVTTGFVDPFANQGGPSFRSFVLFSDGFIPDIAQSSLTDAESDLPLPSDGFALHGNYPNPFRGTTRLSLDLPEPARVTVDVFDLAGRRVHQEEPRMLGSGAAVLTEVDGRALTPGVYLYRVEIEGGRRAYEARGRFVVLR